MMKVVASDQPEPAVKTFKEAMRCSRKGHLVVSEVRLIFDSVAAMQTKSLANKKIIDYFSPPVNYSLVYFYYVIVA